MSNMRAQGGWVIVLSFVAAFYLSILPLPVWAESWRPEWVALVLIYWAFALPGRVGVVSGWFAGLSLDVLEGVTLGQHALSLTIVAYLAGYLHRRVRAFPLWQQSLLVLLLVGINLLLIRMIQSSISQVENGLLYWAPCLISAFLWPWVVAMLRFFQRYFHVR
ncbi:MAG: rod shape-determining protein MreD [Pseudomonadales bacterium]|nr:rod shape-determining protein MreD [Pseudomonadales bacterium]